MNRRNLLAKVEFRIRDIRHKLKELWGETYEHSPCENEIRIMEENVRYCYNKIIEKVESEKTVILTDIRKLYDEASTLRRLLNVDFELNPPNMPLHSVRAYLDERLNNFRGQLQRRQDEIRDLLSQQNELCEELEVDPRELPFDPLPTAEELQEFRNHLNSLKQLRQDRMAEVLQLRLSIKLSLMSLECSLTTDADKALVNGEKLPKRTSDLVKLREMSKRFENLCQELTQNIEAMRKKLNTLWDYLNVDAEWRSRFDEYTTDCQSTFDKLLEEFNQRQLEKKQKQNLKKIITQLREEIALWWQKTLKSDHEMSRFTNFSSEYYTEDLLSQHEMELEELKTFYVSNEKIFELIEKRKELWDRMLALELSANDKNRFNNRGGKLLQEEKERKTVAKNLPTIENQLRELAQDYQAQNGREFTIYGVSVEDMINMDHEKRKQEKEKRSSARKMMNTAANPGSTSRRLLTPEPTPSNLTEFTSINVKKAKSVGDKPSPLKRKMGRHPEDPSTKRSILTELTSPNVVVKPKSLKKPPVKQKKVLDTMQYRAGNRRSSGRHKRRVSGKLVSRGSIPKIKISGEYSDTDSSSCESFVTCLDENSPCRSSVMVKTTPAKPTPSKKMKPAVPSIQVLRPSPRKKTSTKDLPLIM